MPYIDLGAVVGPQGEQGATGAQGIRGEQGLPGPNQVTNSTATPLTGILTGNGSVVGVANIDAAPTADSTGFAQSGGTEKAIKGRVPVNGMGKNLLRNWYFGNPVNQRGQSSYVAASANNYTIDGWRVREVNNSVVLGASGITVNKGTATQCDFYQSFTQDFLTMAVGKQFAISVLLASGEFYYGTFTWGSTFSSISLASDIMAIAGGNTASYTNTCFRFTQEKTVSAVKLELGTEQTLCHNEGTAEAPVWVLNEIPDYEYELYRCTTSTADPYDTYANKTLATGEELAYVENGTTASQNYTAGQYICWNGLLHTANQAISSGATLSAGTGGNLTECVGGGFNNLFVTKTFTITIASIRQYYFVDGTSDITVAGYVPIAINTFDVDEDHCILQKLGFVSNNINTLYYRIKNYDSTTVDNVTFVARVLYARASLIQL